MFKFDNIYAQLPDHFYSRVKPTPFTEGHFPIAFNHEVANLLGLAMEQVDQPALIQALSGIAPLPGSEPLAMLYAGHQFGVYVSQLGDGRAILLGQVRNHNNETWDLHLKGAGLTPYSRNGDGRAVLRSSIREYLCGEAMHALGIPTTRSLCLIGSHSTVEREETEPGALLVRTAPSHIRFGSFEVFFYRRQYEEIRTLADFVIHHHLPHLEAEKEPYLALLLEVIARTARLMSQWQAVGFAHGVMNTDNMSILGITLDYGPFGFLDAYQPGFICNHSDYQGRYAFNQQPQIAHWNLACLAQALLPLLDIDAAKASLDEFPQLFTNAYEQQMQQKLGLTLRQEEDDKLLTDLLALLGQDQVDYTIFFRRLCSFKTGVNEDNHAIHELFSSRQAFTAWATRYQTRLQAENSNDTERQERMLRSNPKYILRNYLAQQAIDLAHQGDYSEIERLHRLLQRPYDEQTTMDHYAAPPPEWAQHIEVSCSS